MNINILDIHSRKCINRSHSPQIPTTLADAMVEAPSKLRLVFCAPNQTAAKIQVKKNFAKSKFEPKIENGSPCHFTFSIKLNPSELKLIERDAQKLNQSVNLYEISEKDDLGRWSSMRCGAKHCRECPDK